MHDQQSPVQKMTAALCYDITSAKTSEEPLYCPFNADGEFMFMDEMLQQQESTDDKKIRKQASIVLNTFIVLEPTTS